MLDKETLLTYLKDEAIKPLTVNDLELAFNIQNTSDFKQLIIFLNELEEAGELVRTRSNRYGIPERMNLIKGTIQGNAKGFAFLLPEEPEHPDVFIAEKDLNGAMNRDRVLVRINHATSGPRMEGEVIRILKRETAQVVGTFQDLGGYGFVVTDDKRMVHDIFIPKAGFNGAAEGHKVVVKITQYPEGRRSAEGEVVEILGHKNDPGVDILSIIRKFELPESFPDEVMRQAEAIPDSISEEEIKNRRDLRDEVIVTIDGADAKDLDDAISLKHLENGNYKLGVHIADVSYFVEEGSPIDREAYERGTSVYLVDRVIPMIPHRLSNGICSLNPKVDRLTLSCEMEITPDGEVVKHDIFPSVIRTTERMTYVDVRQIVERDNEEVIQKYEPLVPFFDLMKELALILRKRRMDRGAIDFDFKEAKVLVDESGKPTDVVIRDRSIAEKIIEEFMLVANETVAEHVHWMNLPFIYRIHEDPNAEKIEAFIDFIVNFGYLVRGSANAVHPSALQRLLEEIKGTPEEPIISTIMLRSMKQAKYAADSSGHFGLAAEFYTHFTSPIRRYPDLIVHRLLRKYVFEGKIDENVQDEWSEKLPAIAEHTSGRERRAVDAERETDDLKKAEYMADKIGEEFDGVINGVTSFGLFVELPNTIEGLIHVSFLTDDYYHFHEQHYALIGERTGQVFRIGDPIRVRVAKVDVEERSIDFELVEAMKRDEIVGLSKAKVIKLSEAKKGQQRQARRRSGSGEGRGNGRGDKENGRGAQGNLQGNTQGKGKSRGAVSAKKASGNGSGLKVTAKKAQKGRKKR